MLQLQPQHSRVGGKVPSLVFPCWCSWSHQPCPSALHWAVPSALTQFVSRGLWAVCRQWEEGLSTALHPTVCRLGLHITWHELLFRWILFQWVHLAVVAKLSIKTVNTPRLRPVQTHCPPTKLPWLNITEWLADVQSLPILLKPLNNLSDLIFKMFTVSADSCTVQQPHQGQCTYSVLCPKRCERQRTDRAPRELLPGWAWCYRHTWNLAASCMQVINIQR